MKKHKETFDGKKVSDNKTLDDTVTNGDSESNRLNYAEQ